MKTNMALLGCLYFFAMACDSSAQGANNAKAFKLGAFGKPSISTTHVTVYPAPENEVLNTAYKITADGQEVSVYDIKVASGSEENRIKAKEDIAASGNYFDVAGMAYFDLKSGPVTVAVSVKAPIAQARILPESLG